MSNGLLNLSGWELVIVTVILTQITIASVTIFLHRHQSHNALQLHPVASHFFRFWLWLTTSMVTKQWVAVHRKHHAKCETEEDPHSPQVFGIKKLLLEGTELYRAEARNPETLEKYGQGTPDDWLERKLYARHPFYGITLMLLLDVALFGAIGITIFAVQMIWIPVWAAGVINGIGHFWGYRNFETQDASRNISPWGLFIGGEELHNNHHAHPHSARLSNKWWELDIGWFYIRLLEIFGLAKVKKLAAKIQTVDGKHMIDIETVRAVIRHRFYIMKLYGRKVVKPVIKHERRSADGYVGKLFRRVRKLMTREDIKLDSSSMQALNDALKHSKTLETVYHFKQQLKELWQHSANNQARRVERLQQWCHDAEKTGIQALQDFAAHLRSYTLQAA
ncbi:MAG: fatty acid desaturase [Gammaproteobacteria bacterium]